MVEVLSRATQRFIVAIGVLQVVKCQRGQNLLISYYRAFFLITVMMFL